MRKVRQQKHVVMDVPNWTKVSHQSLVTGPLQSAIAEAFRKDLVQELLLFHSPKERSRLEAEILTEAIRIRDRTNTRLQNQEATPGLKIT